MGEKLGCVSVVAPFHRFVDALNHWFPPENIHVSLYHFVSERGRNTFTFHFNPLDSVGSKQSRKQGVKEANEPNKQTNIQAGGQHQQMVTVQRWKNPFVTSVRSTGRNPDLTFYKGHPKSLCRKMNSLVTSIYVNSV